MPRAPLTIKQRRRAAGLEPRQPDRRESAHKRGYTSKWARYSDSYRKSVEPLCRQCKEAGRYVPAECVDHIVPVSGPDDPLFWEPNNHQALCQSCHSRKTAKEDGAFGNDIRQRRTG